MNASNLNREDPEAIRGVFQRLCRAGSSVDLAFGSHHGSFRLLAESPERLVLALGDVERGRWELKPGARLTLALRDRGLPFEAVVEFEGHGRFHGIEASRVSLPRLLRAMETHRLADYVPEPPVPCSFADPRSDVREGLIQAFGMDGLELAFPETVRDPEDLLRPGQAATVEFHGTEADHFVFRVRTAYLGEHAWGLRFPGDGDPQEGLGRYRQWLQEARHAQHQLDLQGFDPAGSEAKALPAPSLAPPRTRLLVDRDPLVLVLAEGESFPARLGPAVGRKIGVASLDLVRGAIRPCLGDLGATPGAPWGRVRLILVHHLLRSGSPLDLCRRLVQEEQCPLPILLAGTEEEALLKRNRALAAGAVDYLVVEPFRVLSVLRALDSTLQLFA